MRFLGADVVYVHRLYLQAMQTRGLRVVSPGGDFDVKPAVTGDLASIGTADVVFLGVKAHGLTALAPQLRSLFKPETVVVSTQNGIPWWYFQEYAGEPRDLNGLRLERVDPGGAIAAAIEPRRVIGSLAYFSTDIVEPGVIHHTEGNRISLGEPDGTRSERRLKRMAPKRSSTPASAARPRPESATKSGSSCSATWRSIRSAHSPAQRSRKWCGIPRCRGRFER